MKRAGGRVSWAEGRQPMERRHVERPRSRALNGPAAKETLKLTCIMSSDSYWMEEVSMDTLAQNLGTASKG